MYDEKFQQITLQNFLYFLNAWVWHEFSEYLLETRVLTSADFNMYPLLKYLFINKVVEGSNYKRILELTQMLLLAPKG